MECRWADGIRCAYCERDRISSPKTQRQTPPYHCKDCGKNFTVKTGIVMHNSRLPLSKWVIAFGKNTVGGLKERATKPYAILMGPERTHIMGI